ncbi:hypothetical protein [Prevotella sp.]
MGLLPIFTFKLTTFVPYSALWMYSLLPILTLKLTTLPHRNPNKKESSSFRKKTAANVLFGQADLNK